MSDQIDSVAPIEETSAMKTVQRLENTSAQDECALKVDSSSDKSDVDERVSTLKAEVEIQQKKAAPPNQSSRPPKIQMVPSILRHRNHQSDKHYQPKVVSIGPIHYGIGKLSDANDQYKRKLAAGFIKESGKDAKSLYKIIKRKIRKLKEHYDGEVLKRREDKDLVWILFLDGCSILMFIWGFFHGQLEDLGIKTNDIALMQNDLFLLENQIPLEVLRLLINSAETRFKTELKESIEWFICLNAMVPVEYKWKLYFDMDSLGHQHLLGLLHHVTVQPGESLISKKKKKFKSSHRKDIMQVTFRNVQELKESGIELKPSKSCSLRDITFDSFWLVGRLRLPPLVVDKSTGTKFFNLIAYESCPDNSITEYEVSSYISFMNSLVDNVLDVKDLRSANIIRNYFVTDVEVASLLNEIGMSVPVVVNTYSNVKNKIQKHFQRRCGRWVAQVYHDHFRSPWTILALIGAVMGLFLTGVQTWLTYRSCK